MGRHSLAQLGYWREETTLTMKRQLLLKKKNLKTFKKKIEGTWQAEGSGNIQCVHKIKTEYGRAKKRGRQKSLGCCRRDHGKLYMVVFMNLRNVH